MQIEVWTLNLRGKSLPKEAWEKEAPCRGRLRVRENRMHAFGRAVLTASLHGTTDGHADELLPALLDAQIIWAEEGRMRLRGQELIDGALYGQTWDIKVIGC